MKAETRNIEITFFAQLKEFFPEKLNLDVPVPATVKDLFVQLQEINPEAKRVLQVSRIADREQILSADMQVDEQETLFILPPSSGG